MSHPGAVARPEPCAGPNPAPARTLRRGPAPTRRRLISVLVDGFSTSALLAAVLGLLLLPVAFIPYVAWSFRRGRTGPGHALISALGLIYLMALWTYTIAPVPQTDQLICDGTLRAQFVPFRFLRDVDTGGGLRGVLTDRALLQVVLNVLFFVPLGMLVRHLLRWRARWCVVAGLGVSLAIELTQLTGNWFIYPCAYRLFDTDDLIANTLGAAIGVVAAPLLALVPGQHVGSPKAPRPVRPLRRLTGMTVDLLSVLLVSGGITLGVRVMLYLNGHDIDAGAEAVQVGAIVAAALVFGLVVPLATGATLGHHLTYLRPARSDGRPPTWGQWIRRFLTGVGAYVALSLPAELGVPGTGQLTVAWVVLSAVVVLWVDTRGISGYAAGLVLADAREPDPRTSLAERGTDPRRLSSAVVTVGSLGYLALAVLLTVAALSPLGLRVAGVVLAGLVLANLALVCYLVYTGIVVVHREGRGLGNLLSLLAVAGLLGLIALLVLASLLEWAWLVILTVATLTVSATYALLFGAFLIYGIAYARAPARTGMDGIVVLGSRVYGDHVPPLLAARIDRGLEILAVEVDQGRRPLLILSGGKGSDETEAEGVVMARYAERAGAAGELVRVEDASRSTEENLTFSRDLLVAEGRGTTLVVATNDFHAFRAAIIARELGLDAQVVGAPTARYYFPSAVLREFVGVLARRPVVHALAALVIALGSGALAWLLTR